MHGHVLLYSGVAGIFIALLLGLSIIGVVTTERRQVVRTLASIGADSPGRPAGEAMGFGERVLTPLVARAASVVRRLQPGASLTRLAKWRDLAGNPPQWTIERILAGKVLTLAVGAAVGALLGQGSGRQIAYGLIGAAAGFFLPDLLLYNAGLHRQEQIGRSLPDALDLLVIGAEAGLAFDAALLQVAHRIRGPLAGDLMRVIQEMQLGNSRSAALHALGQRTTVPELRSFTTALVQADKLGIPIANVLRDQAKEMRLKRQQKAEEKAQKVPIKILFPLVVCILPSLFIIILGPGAMTIYKTLGGG